MSMDSKARWVVTMFVECFWRSVPYDEVYLKAYGSPYEAETQLEQYFHFYNTACRHWALDRPASDVVYFEGMDKAEVA